MTANIDFSLQEQFAKVLIKYLKNNYFSLDLKDLEKQEDDGEKWHMDDECEIILENQNYPLHLSCMQFTSTDIRYIISSEYVKRDVAGILKEFDELCLIVSQNTDTGVISAIITGDLHVSIPLNLLEDANLVSFFGNLSELRTELINRDNVVA